MPPSSASNVLSFKTFTLKSLSNYLRMRGVAWSMLGGKTSKNLSIYTLSIQEFALGLKLLKQSPNISMILKGKRITVVCVTA